DRLLVEKDPLALELFERYSRVAMPNLRPDETAAAAVLTYLQVETDRQHPRTVQAVEAHVHQMDHMDHSGHKPTIQPMIQERLTTIQASLDTRNASRPQT